MDYKVEHRQKFDLPNAAELRRSLKAEGYGVYQWSDAPGVFYPNHQHHTDQSHWIISGELELTIDNAEIFTLVAGDRDLMPAGTIHSARITSEESCVYLIGERKH